MAAQGDQTACLRKLCLQQFGRVRRAEQVPLPPQASAQAGRSAQKGNRSDFEHYLSRVPDMPAQLGDELVYALNRFIWIFQSSNPRWPGRSDSQRQRFNFGFDLLRLVALGELEVIHLLKIQP